MEPNGFVHQRGVQFVESDKDHEHVVVSPKGT